MTGKDLIRPGLTIKVVIDIDNLREMTDVRSSTIYNISGKQIIIAQTDPPILKSRLNQPVIITYLTREGGEPVRYGFHANITDFIKDYELMSSQKVNAVKVVQKNLPTVHNLRLFYRLEPPSNSGIEMYIYSNQANILDISLGGAKISHNRANRFDIGKPIKAIIVIDGREFQVDAMVLRTWAPEDPRMISSLEFIALEFLSPGAEFKNILGRKIVDIQRELRYKETFKK